MDVETFWKLIDRTRMASEGDLNAHANLLIEELTSLSADEILAFQAIVEDLMDNAYDAALWDAAYIIGCGCSDDGFEDFRGWLVMQGEEAYEEALVDPESLVDRIEINERARAGVFLNVPMKAYQHKTGREMPFNYREPPLLRGTLWAEEDKNSRFPKLASKFGDCD